MRHLILFEKYNPREDSRGRELSTEEALQIIKSKCDFDRAIEYPIYRGIRAGQGDMRFVDPKSKSPRQSRNTNNIYTLIVDNHQAWQGFPKRSESLICSTDTSKTSRYGDTYLILPYKDAKIGICPDSDFWSSFDRNADDVNTTIEEMFDLYGIELPGDDYYELRQAMKYCEENFMSETGQDDFRTLIRDWNSREMMSDFLDNHKGKSLMSYIEYLFEPKGFSVVDYKDFREKNNSHEVWTDSPCVMINITKISLDKLKNLIWRT
jgi:hypothetical protein